MKYLDVLKRIRNGINLKLNTLEWGVLGEEEITGRDYVFVKKASERNKLFALIFSIFVLALGGE